MWVLVTSSCKLPYSCGNAKIYVCEYGQRFLCYEYWPQNVIFQGIIIPGGIECHGMIQKVFVTLNLHSLLYVNQSCKIIADGAIIYGNSAYQLRSVLSRLTIPTAGSAHGYKGARGVIWVRQWCHCDLIGSSCGAESFFYVLRRKNISADILHPNRNFSRVETELRLAGVLDGTLWESVFRADL